MLINELMRKLNKIKKYLKGQEVHVYILEDDPDTQCLSFLDIREATIVYTSIPDDEFPWCLSSESLIEENKSKFLKQEDYNPELHLDFRPIIYIRGAD